MLVLQGAWLKAAGLSEDAPTAQLRELVPMTASCKCPICDDTGWVCEAHPDRPSEMFSQRADACDCGGAAMPCLICNPSDAEQPPDMSRTGLIVEDSDSDDC
jgi:hypothetical protein